VNRAWAVANKPVLDRFIPAYNKAVNWFQDRNNRAAAVKIMMEIGRQKQEDVEKSYDFLQQGNFYELTGKIPRGSLSKLIEVLQELGDLPPGFTVDRLLMPGVAEIGP
jgi:ABC-type nitrate/sulfonate/bicarbonate transport system substrate-binding protein